MNRPRFGLVFIFLIATQAAGLGAPPFAGQGVQTDGRVAGSVTATPISSSASLFRVDAVATGTLSHIGRIQTTWTVPEVMLDLVNLQLIVANLQWHGTLTAANGDQIFGEYAFRDDTIPLSPTGTLVFEVDLTITGGTGRFKDASGQAAAVGTANVFSGVFTIDVDGQFFRGNER
jgi:hypothetical protein